MPRQHQVEHDQIGRAPRDPIERLHAVGRLLDCEALLRQIVANQLADVGFVLDHQDLLRWMAATGFAACAHQRVLLLLSMCLNVLALHHEDHHLGDIGGVVGDPLEILRHEQDLALRTRSCCGSSAM